MEGKLSDRRIVTTKWVGNAWDKIKSQKDTIQHSFLKCGLTNALDGSENDLVKIQGIEDYTFPEPEKEFQLVSNSDGDSGPEEYVINENVSDAEEIDNSSVEDEVVTDNSNEEEA